MVEIYPPPICLHRVVLNCIIKQIVVYLYLLTIHDQLINTSVADTMSLNNIRIDTYYIDM
jgi:hypothetical protein